MKILKYKKGKGVLPPLAFAILMIILLILIVAFVPQVRTLVLELFGKGSTTIPINATP
ncbi:hypothetical protein HY638_03260 [Candidatus Woesearchaeota archaeon]|nr:hypothetical protein [Candidatus Woesearchaeota archaeon]